MRKAEDAAPPGTSQTECYVGTTASVRRLAVDQVDDLALGHRPRSSGALVARREKMNKEEFEKAIAEVAERLDLYLDEQVDARLEVEEGQKQS